MSQAREAQVEGREALSLVQSTKYGVCSIFRLVIHCTQYCVLCTSPFDPSGTSLYTLIVTTEVYRQCASVLVFREVGKEFEVLLLRKPRKNDAWQLPQGGIEAGENLIEAALRELKEEAGIEAKVFGQSKRVYQYEYPASYRRFRPDNVRGQRIGFIFAQVLNESAVKVDEHEIHAFVWVTPKDLPKYLKRKEYRSLVLSLIQEGEDLLR